GRKKLDLEVGKDFTGRIKLNLKHGVVVKMDDHERDGFAHISELTPLYGKYLKQASDMYSAGDE
ncbi:unnamed protein product, partial [Prorocentrum cordatum]